MTEQRYEIIKLLGKGRTGGVYEAEDTNLGRKVAMRRFFAQSKQSDISEYMDEFEEVSRSLSALQHPNLLQVCDAGVDDDGAYIISTLLKGETLYERIKEGPLTVGEAHELATQMLDALSASHKEGFVHGAITPGSILMSPRARGGFLYVIMDMGLSRLAPLIQGEGSFLAVMADPAVLAPELFGGGEADERADLYMLGHILYMGLAGGHPFAGVSSSEAEELHKKGLPPIEDYNQEVPEDFRLWIEKLIQQNPEDRPASAVEALKLLPALNSPAVVVSSEPTSNAAPILNTGAGVKLNTAPANTAKTPVLQTATPANTIKTPSLQTAAPTNTVKTPSLQTAAPTNTAQTPSLQTATPAAPVTPVSPVLQAGQSITQSSVATPTASGASATSLPMTPKKKSKAGLFTMLGLSLAAMAVVAVISLRDSSEEPQTSSESEVSEDELASEPLAEEVSKEQDLEEPEKAVVEEKAAEADEAEEAEVKKEEVAEVTEDPEVDMGSDESGRVIANFKGTRFDSDGWEFVEAKLQTKLEDSDGWDINSMKPKTFPGIKFPLKSHQKDMFKRGWKLTYVVRPVRGLHRLGFTVSDNVNPGWNGKKVGLYLSIGNFKGRIVVAAKQANYKKKQGMTANVAYAGGNGWHTITVEQKAGDKPGSYTVTVDGTATFTDTFTNNMNLGKDWNDHLFSSRYTKTGRGHWVVKELKLEAQ